MKKISKRVLAVALISVMTLLMCSCGKKKEDAGKYSSQEIFDTVSKAITDMPDMTTVKSGDENAKEIFTYLSDVNMDEVKDFVYTYASEGSAEEIAVIRMKNKSKMTKINNDLNKRLENRRHNFETYNADELDKFDGAVVVVKDNYAILLIGKQAQNGKYEFDKMLK